MKTFDGLVYTDSEALPDLGNLVPMGNASGYFGASGDAKSLPTVAKYPKYKGYLRSGAVFFATDTKALEMYNETSDSWE